MSLSSADIRRQFIEFFVQKHGHTFVPSSPVVPHDDPTLLFTNAGMNQFKPIFLGTEKRPYTRAVNTQKCIRAGGKHNDLDDVGRSRRHHTFFEMLGNWSFGDYFKRGAIEMAWELLTKVWKLPADRLHVSVYAGDEANGVPRDVEAVGIWKEVAGIPDERIHFGGKDNFWEMGDTGPCGPCTEIFIDRTPDQSGGPSVLSGEDPRVMEIWNNVFIQYNRQWKGGGEAAVRAFDTVRIEPLPGEDAQAAKNRIRLQNFGTIDRSHWVAQNSTLEVLPAQHVDTGMGFERICQVLQDKDSNYSIDLFDPFWQKLTDLSGVKYAGRFPKTNSADPAAEAADAQLRHDIAFRVIADHIRCLTFALTDGAEPSNEGRGYVLRRILRRAVRFGRQQLELKEPFLHTLVPVVVDAMGGAFPELKKNPGRVAELIKGEEVSFGKTLERGLRMFEQAATGQVIEFGDGSGWGGGGIATDGSGEIVIPDVIAFKLHDTYGFPIDLTRIMAEERGMKVDLAGYEKLMEEAREKARSGGKDSDNRLFELPPDAVAHLQSKVQKTDDSAKYADRQLQVEATVKAIWNGEEFVDVASSQIRSSGEREMFAVILDRTNFYSEMGGQVGDQGEIRGGGIGTAKGGGANFIVKATRMIGGHVLHIGFPVAGPLRVGTTVESYLAEFRKQTQQNHTSTHLANWALREVLGDDVQQKGSLVDPDKLRFDFSHGKSLSDDELSRVESLVGQCIEKKLPVYAEEAPQEKALKINGLRAVFGEKYPSMVRVVSIGAPVSDLLSDPANPKWRQFSIEFCGGTHLKSSADAGGFVVTAEESVSKGIRRIVALTGEAAHRAHEAAKAIDAQIEHANALPEAELPPVIQSLQKAVAGGGVSLLAKRRANAAVAQLQAKLKAWEKSRQKSEGGAGAAAAAENLLAGASPLGPGKMIVGQVDGATADALLGVVDSLKKKLGSYALLLAATGDDKVSFVAAVSDDLIKVGLKAGDWVREAAKATGGGGGGRPNMAQAGGKDPAKLPGALAAATAFATKAVGA